MKATLLALLMLVSTSAFARQYVQCSIIERDSTDVMVVNLTSEQGGTLFLSSGMQNPEDERILIKIALEKIENGKHIYKVINEEGEGQVALPSSVIGVRSDFFTLDLIFAGYRFKYSCFARIYND